MNVTLLRHSYSKFETEGSLSVASLKLFTMERPWIPGVELGGSPFLSCVPDGEYTLSPWVRPGGAEVYILENPELGVWKQEEDRPDGHGRYLILIHTGNFVSDVVGCIAPGISHGMLLSNKTGRMERAVTGSAGAMQRLKIELGRQEIHHLTITPSTGARGVR
jgi:hypothetical protein